MKKALLSALFLLFLLLGPLSPANAAAPIAQKTAQEKQEAASAADFGTFCSRTNNEKGCAECFQKNPPQAWTAIGCIPAEPGEFVSKFMGVGIGIAGGVAFLLIIFGGFQILTSAGNPEQLNAGRELVSSAIAGLLLIIFSVFILRIIGVDILGIPGFK